MNPDVVYAPKEKILEAAQQFETPFYLYDEACVRENVERFKGAFLKYFPDFQALFAVKANPNPEFMRIVLDAGFDGLDASSLAEVELAKQLGVTGMYTGNYTPAEVLKQAKDAGFILNLDDISMIPFLEKIGAPDTLSFRINPGVGKATMENNVLAGPDAKYGIPHEQAVDAYRQAKAPGIKHFGIHAMTGTNVPLDDQDYFAGIVEKLFEVVVAVKNEIGIEIEFMNMGGGFGVPYGPEEGSLDMNYIAKSIRGVFDRMCKKHGLKEPRLIAEPGRYIGAGAGWLVGKVDVIKDGYKKFVGIDASTNDNPRPAFYGAYHYVSVLGCADGNDLAQGENLGRGDKEKVSLVGSICENNDQFAKDRLLPKCEVGDIVAIHNSGAHVYAMAHNYNGKLRHAEYVLKLDGSFQKIRRAETLDDLFATLDV